MFEIFIQTDNIFKYFVNLSKQNGNRSAILNLIRTKLHRIHEGMVINTCVYYWKKTYSLVISIRTDKIFKYFVNLSKQKWRPYKCLCKVSEKNIHWCWRYSSRQTNLGRTAGQPDGRTAGRTDGRTDGAQIIIPHKFLIYPYPITTMFYQF